MRRTAELGLMLTLALILSYVESLIPLSFGIPGIKLGLPNLIVLLLLYGGGEKSSVGKNGKISEKENGKSGAAHVRFFTKAAGEALLVNVLRIVLAGFLFTNLYAILYALAGAALSFLAMLVGRRAGCFSMVGVSILGGVFHNIGQILVAMAVVETFAVAYYLPFLMAAGVVTGAVLGFIGMAVLPYLRRLASQ
ncbi:MAG: Gx transporter family protein [Bacteroidales bacterium]|nr:Gx transporter family protein [Bacteroidales bacterium]MCM1422286.1 Gx transporter family protein [bacterium]